MSNIWNQPFFHNYIFPLEKSGASLMPIEKQEKAEMVEFNV